MKKVIVDFCLISGLPVTLTFNPVVDTQYDFLTEVVLDIKQCLMEEELPIKEKISIRFQIIVKSKNVDGVEVQFTYQDASYVLISPILKMGYDSKKIIESPTELDKIHEKIFCNIIGKTFTVTVSPNGSINSVNGMDFIIEEITQVVADNGDIGERLSSSILNQWLGESAIKGMLEQSFRFYPSNAVTIGESWDIESKYGISNKKSSVKAKYILKEIEDSAVTITTEASVNLEPGEGLDGMLSGSQFGTFQIDTKTGMPSLSELTLNIKGPVNSVMQNTEMSMDMVAQIKTAIKEVDSTPLSLAK